MKKLFIPVFLLTIFFTAEVFSQVTKAPVSVPAASSGDATATVSTAPPKLSEAGEKKEAMFDQMFAKFIESGKSIAALQKEYENASPTRQYEIVKEAEPLMDATRKLYMEIVPVAIDLFKTERLTTKKTLNDFLLDYVDGLTAQDDYEKAYSVATMLWMGGLQKDHPELMELTGITAFMVNFTATAEDCFKQARAAGKLSPSGAMYASLVPYYKEAYAAEKKIQEAEAQANDLPQVLIQTTKGDITVELFENEAPNTVANFISLIKKDFYKGKTFHRVIPGFMAQGGCPDGTGGGGPGYCIKCETGNPNARKHFRGTLSMARTDKKDTGGSQFFITFVPTQHLDGVHTAFGRIIKGWDVLAKLERIDPDRKIPGQEPDKIINIKILRTRQHEYVPETLPAR